MGDELDYHTCMLIGKWQCTNKCINKTIPGHECYGEKNMVILFREKGFPGSTSGKEPICQSKRYKGGGFNLWVRKISRTEVTWHACTH